MKWPNRPATNLDADAIAARAEIATLMGRDKCGTPGCINQAIGRYQRCLECTVRRLEEAGPEPAEQIAEDVILDMETIPDVRLNKLWFVLEEAL